MRGQWGYAAISAILGVAAAYSSSIVLLCTIVVYNVCGVMMLRRLPFVVCIFSCVIMFLYTDSIEKQNTSKISSGLTSFTGVIAASPSIDGDKLSVIARTNSKEKLQISYILKSQEEKTQWSRLHPGITCTFQGELREPSAVRNPGAFDYKEYLHRQHIHYLFSASSISSCYVSSPSFTSWILSVRQSAVHYVQATFPKDIAGFINSLVYGDRQDLSGEVETQYQQLGLIHLLAISGSHISLLIAMCYYILLRGGCTKETALALLLVILPLYMFLAGASPSVMRASIMAIFILTCSFLTLRLSGLDALSLAVISMLLWDPYILYDIGFQFSIISTAVLLLSVQLLFTRHGWVRNAWNLALAAQLSALPVTLHYFGQFSPYSLLLNLLYVPFLSFVILPFCLIALALSVLAPPLAVFVSLQLGALIRVSNDLLRWCEQLPFNQLTFGQSPVWLTALYSATIVLLFLAWEGYVLKKYAGYFGVALVLLGLFHYVSPYMNPYGKVTFIDVGQGDCILIQLPFANGTYLIDTGGTMTTPREQWQQRKTAFSVGQDIVLPSLRYKGIKRLDKLILTHGDQDHVGAALDILQEIPVGEVILGQKDVYSEQEQDIMMAAKQQGIAIRIVKNGDSWIADESSFSVLSPIGKKGTDNNQSIVLYVQLGGLTWLFTGDLEEEGERQLVLNYPSLHVNVLKVGHHGSKTSTSEEFLQALRPSDAVICVGENNRYGHPYPEVLERLYHHDITVWRTDKEGAITYTFREKKGTFQSQLTYDKAKKPR